MIERSPQRARQGILPFVVEPADRDDMTARAGLPLVVETMRALGIDQIVRRELPPPKRRRGFAPARKLEALVSLLAAGGDRVEDIRILSADKGLETLLGSAFPSPDALLDFLGRFHDPDAWGERPEARKAWVPGESAGLLGLEAVNRAMVARGASRQTLTATIDHDGTIIEAHKREATIAYDGTKGYQPLVAVWAEEQLVVADEFRDGNVAGGDDPLSSARRAFANLPDWVQTRYFRGDSASYYTPLLKYLAGEKIGFSISADMTQQLRARCTAASEDQWIAFDTRQTEQADLAEIEFTPGDWSHAAEPLRYVALRFTPTQTELFGAASPRYLAVVSNRWDLSAAELVRWHWEKAGTIEHVHRVMKDELGAGVMPSGRFGVNAAWFRINAIAFNVLTILKRRALPDRFRTARPKRLRFELFTLAAKLVVHQRRLTLRASADSGRIGELIEARQRLLELARQRRRG